MAITVCVPGYGLPQLTLKCLDYLYKYSGNLVDYLIYVDNGSKPEEVELIRETLSKNNWNKWVLVTNFTNLGFTPAINQGLELNKATNNHFLILNNDCFVGPHTLERLLHAFEDGRKFGVVAPLTNAKGVCCIARGKRLKVFSPAFSSYPDMDDLCNRLLTIQPNIIANAAMVPFFCALLRNETVKQVGLLDQRFVDGLGVDDDWCLLARRRGWRVGIVADAFAAHLHSQTFKNKNLPRNVKGAYAKLRAKHNGKVE